MSRARLAVSVVAVALVLTACSSGKKTGSAAPATTAVAGPTPTTRGTNDPFCNSLNAYNDKYSKVNSGLAQPDQLRAAMQDASTAIGDADRTAPSEIKADVDTLNQAFQQLLGILQATNYDLSKVTLAQLQQFQTPQFTQAGQNVNTYIRDHC
jgi:hypothetical protein